MLFILTIVSGRSHTDSDVRRAHEFGIKYEYEEKLFYGDEGKFMEPDLTLEKADGSKICDLERSFPWQN